MYCKKSIIVIASLCAMIPLAVGFNIRDEQKAKGKDNKSSSVTNSSDVDSLDDRFNLNFNHAQAQGFGPYGQQSLANSLSYGVNAGIRNANGQYQNLYSNSGAQSNGFSSGPGAPLTFANTGSRVRPGYAGGQAGAGVLGGRGSSFAHSQNQNIEIPLDNFGTVLLSNLKAPSNSTETEAEKIEPKEPTAPLVFT